MRSRTLAAGALGTLAGAVLGLVTLAFAAGRVIDAGVAPGTQPGDATVFVVGRGSMTLLILVAGAFGGTVIGAIAYAVGRIADPRERLYPVGAVLAIAAATGAFVAYAASRAAIGAAADSILDGTVTITVFRAAMAALVTGLLVGGVVGAGIERMSKPSLYGFGGEAWPASTAALLRAAAPAIGIPVVGIVVAAAAVFGFSRLLLAASHIVALTLFSLAAALILFGAAAIAAREPKRRG
jgi:hypothetical protein